MEIASAECRQTRQVALLDELERRAAARGDVVDLVGEAEVGRALALSPPPTTVKPGARGNRLGDRAGPGCETRVFEDAHGAVPEHRPRAGDLVARTRRRAGPDVEPDPAGRQVGVRIGGPRRIGAGPRRRRTRRPGRGR